MSEPPEDPVELLPKALDKLQALEAMARAIEGYRNQLSVFSDTMILEITIMKGWLADAIGILKAERKSQ